MGRDWREWHTEYDDPNSRLSRRLHVVQSYIRDALDSFPPGPIRVISACAGEGRDLFGVLADHSRARDVTGRLVELDPDLSATAARHAPPGIDVVCADASLTSAYESAVPADLVLVCGVFGNISDADIEHTVRALPSLSNPGAIAIWTRHTRAPDRTVDIRRWFVDAGYEELGFTASDNLFGVGANRLVTSPTRFRKDARLFDFVGYGMT